jgi:chromosome segregation ATPase
MSDVGERRPNTAVLRARIYEQLGDLEGVVHRLQQKMEGSVSEFQETRRDRSRTQELELRAELLSAQLRAAEARWNAGLVEQARLQAQTGKLQKSQARLKTRCVELEEALAEIRQREGAARAEMECLVEQVTQLQSIIDLLLRRAGT